MSFINRRYCWLCTIALIKLHGKLLAKWYKNFSPINLSNSSELEWSLFYIYFFDFQKVTSKRILYLQVWNLIEILIMKLSHLIEGRYFQKTFGFLAKSWTILLELGFLIYYKNVSLSTLEKLNLQKYWERFLNVLKMQWLLCLIDV